VCVEHAVELDAVFLEGIDEESSLLIFERADFFEIERACSGARPEKTVTEARAFFVGPVHEFERDGMIGFGDVTAHGF